MRIPPPPGAEFGRRLLSARMSSTVSGVARGSRRVLRAGWASPGGSDRWKGRTRRMDERNQAQGGRSESSWLMCGSLECASNAANQLQSILLSLQQTHMLTCVQSTCTELCYSVTMNSLIQNQTLLKSTVRLMQVHRQQGGACCHWLKLKMCTSTSQLVGHAQHTTKDMRHETSARRAHVHKNSTHCSFSWLSQLLASGSV